MIGLDTSAIIDLFRDDPALIRLLEQIDDTVVLNQISYLELMFGLDFESRHDKSEEEYYDSLFNLYSVLPLDNISCKKAAKISLELKKLGKSIEQFDCTIAGILLANGINKILTRNKKHFENIRQLDVISY
ncbi:PIN domain-containing protein [Candidatus Woesearchaeota archaeon]|nr:PIN domain-containing protein [Candidatus Woesearchaeota archaeon]MBI2131104.1 PIN domain-containing protein [Candidatus Woesearchaeota archaeon]MBI2660646.1 PIN domain-containing protein [Candidatus Woesearchaeota archaeon]